MNIVNKLPNLSQIENSTNNISSDADCEINKLGMIRCSNCTGWFESREILDKHIYDCLDEPTL